MPQSASAAKATKARKPGARGDALVPPTGNSHGTVMAEQTERPESWESVRLGELLREVDVRQADLPKTEANALEVLSLTKNDGLILQSVRFGKRIATDDTSKYKVVREGQIVYNPYVIWEGAVHALRKHRAGLVSPVYPVWETVERDGGFLDYLLRTPSLIDAYNRVCSGAVNRRRSIREEAFTAIKVTVPPLRERRAIAEVLLTVQQAKEATEKIIAATRQLKASLMKHLFTYGPVPLDQAAYIPLKETAIGTMPAAWSVARVGEIGEVVTGTTPSTKRPEFYGGPHMFITPGDMGARKYIAQTEKWLTDVGLAECRALPKNAVVVVCIGATIGKTGLTGADNCATNQQCNSVIASEQVNPEFLFYGLSNRAPALPPLASRAAVPIVNKSNFCEFQVALPPLSEQREISAQLSAVDGKLAAEERRREALDALFKSLVHHLMTGKLRVKDLALPRLEGNML